MIFVNLLPKSQSKSLQLSALVALNLACLLGLTLGGYSFSQRTASHPLAEVPMGVDERQAAIATLDRLEIASPALSPQAEVLKSELSNPTYNCQINTKQQAWMEQESDRLIFSRRFFEEDPITQASALTHGLTTISMVATRPANSQPAE